MFFQMKPIIWSWFAPDLFQKRGPKNSALPKNLFENAEVNKLFEEKKSPSTPRLCHIGNFFDRPLFHLRFLFPPKQDRASHPRRRGSWDVMARWRNSLSWWHSSKSVKCTSAPPAPLEAKGASRIATGPRNHRRDPERWALQVSLKLHFNETLSCEFNSQEQ